MTLAKKQNLCSRSPDEQPRDSCCDTESPWCFSGAVTDQGLLFHLTVDESQDRRVSSSGEGWTQVGAVQATNQPKPWRMDQLPELMSENRMGQVQGFWKDWANGQSALMEHD